MIKIVDRVQSSVPFDAIEITRDAKRVRFILDGKTVGEANLPKMVAGDSVRLNGLTGSFKVMLVP